MFFMHIAYSLNLIALSFGTALLMWSMKAPGKGSWLGKLIGGVVMVLSIISVVCMFSCAMKGGPECHGPSMMNAMTPAPAMEGGPGHEHDHMMKKVLEHKKS